MSSITEDTLHVVVAARPAKAWLAPTPVALRVRGEEAQREGDPVLAAELLRQAASLSNGATADLVALGLALEGAGELESAAQALGRAVLQASASALPIQALARVLRKLGRFEEAERALAHLLSLNPVDVSTRAALGSVRLELGDIQGALQALTGAIRQVPDSPEVASVLAEAWLQAGRPGRARKVLARLPAEAARGRGPSLAAAEIALATAAPKAAAEALAPHVDQPSRSPRWLAAAMQVAVQSGRADEAWSWFAAHERGGGTLDARLLEAAAGAATSAGDPHVVLASIGEHLARPLAADDRTRLLFARGDLLDRTGDPDGAALSWLEGNARLGGTFLADEAWDRVADLQTCFSPNRLAQGSRAPMARGVIIVVGAPGAGAGAVASLLAEHAEVSDVTPTGGLPALEETLPRYTGRPWPDSLSGLGRSRAVAAARHALGLPGRPRGRVVLQLGGAGLFGLGALPLILPGARIVLVHRNAWDQGLSQFRRPLRGPGLEHTSRLEDIAAMDAVYRELLGYWRFALPVAPVEVSYDRLATQPEATLGRLLRNLNLAPQPALAHRIHARGHGRWARYARWLGPVGELAD